MENCERLWLVTIGHFTLAIQTGRSLRAMFSDRKTQGLLDRHIQDLYEAADRFESEHHSEGIDDDEAEELVRLLKSLLAQRVAILQEYGLRHGLPNEFLQSLESYAKAVSPSPPVA